MTIMDNTGPRPICACRREAASPMQPLRERRPMRRTRGAASWALPSVALALVPKCPMCIAAYLAIGGGLGVSLSTAAHLRTALVWLCWSTLLLLTVRLVMRFTSRRRGSTTTAPSVRRDTLRSTARASAA